MPSAPLPGNEPERLALLQQYNILDTPPEEAIDRIVNLAARLFSVPIVLVGLMDRDRQWFKSVRGLDVTESDRQFTFCAHTILHSQMLVVEDATLDPRFADNPAVTGPLGIRFYAGVPLQVRENLNLGTLCIADTRPRTLDAAMRSTLEDLAAIVVREINLYWQASHDQLTELLNRTEFERRVTAVLTQARIARDRHALCYIDIDWFQVVNETCGHEAGDELLRQFTALVKKAVHPADTVARMGGNKFAVLFSPCGPDESLKIVQALHEQIRDFRFNWQNRSFNVGASIGLVAIDRESIHLSAVLGAADAACHAAKDSGRNRVWVYRANDAELLKRQLETEWVARIAQAYEDKRFCLYYQPIAAATTPEKFQHCEILLRLQDEQGHMVLPMAFMPAAERYKLMHTLDRWIIRTLFEQLQTCRNAAGDDDRLYSVNLSGASLNDDQFIGFLRECFLQFRVPPKTICFEITETVAIANLLKAAQFIHELKVLGCQFALDDFGSGMSSFSYLKHLPVDYLKIDGSFIRNIVNDSVDCAMVQAINHVGHVMGIFTVAEFVENEAILQKVRELGVDYVQGYAIARPSPLAGLLSLCRLPQS